MEALDAGARKSSPIDRRWKLRAGSIGVGKPFGQRERTEDQNGKATESAETTDRKSHTSATARNTSRRGKYGSACLRQRTLTRQLGWSTLSSQIPPVVTASESAVAIARDSAAS